MHATIRSSLSAIGSVSVWIASLVTGPAAWGGLVALDLTTGGAAGVALNSSGTYTLASWGLTIDAVAASTEGNASFSANQDGGGVDTAGLVLEGNPSDAASQLDSFETLTLTLTFAASTSAALVSIDLQGVGADILDAALVSINGGAEVQLHTGQSNFNGSTDVWSPTGIEFASGDTITFATTDRMSIQGLTLDVTAVPEPGVPTALAIALIALHRARHRNRADRSRTCTPCGTRT